MKIHHDSQSVRTELIELRDQAAKRDSLQRWRRGGGEGINCVASREHQSRYPFCNSLKTNRLSLQMVSRILLSACSVWDLCFVFLSVWQHTGKLSPSLLGCRNIVDRKYPTKLHIIVCLTTNVSSPFAGRSGMRNGS